jgi:XTP/dITP diphosphohydrolase
MDSIVFASHNPAKIAFVKKIFAKLPVTIRNQGEYGVPSVSEDKPTFIENALLKARNACLHTNLPAIADDSGLLVPSLGNKPGIRTNRYAGEEKTKEQAITKLLTELKGMTGLKRMAKFICTMVFLKHADDPTPLLLQHEMVGEIAEQSRGQGQYGFDTIFYLPSYQSTFAELTPSVQDREDPRHHVLKQLVDHINHIEWGC